MLSTSVVLNLLSRQMIGIRKYFLLPALLLTSLLMIHLQTLYTCVIFTGLGSFVALMRTKFSFYSRRFSLLQGLISWELSLEANCCQFWLLYKASIYISGWINPPPFLTRLALLIPEGLHQQISKSFRNILKSSRFSYQIRTRSGQIDSSHFLGRCLLHFLCQYVLELGPISKIMQRAFR